MLDALSRLIEWHHRLNDQITWRGALTCGGVAAVAYTVYCFGVKPFLSPLRKVAAVLDPACLFSRMVARGCTMQHLITCRSITEVVNFIECVE